MSEISPNSFQQPRYAIVESVVKRPVTEMIEQVGEVIKTANATTPEKETAPFDIRSFNPLDTNRATSLLEIGAIERYLRETNIPVPDSMAAPRSEQPTATIEVKQYEQARSIWSSGIRGATSAWSPISKLMHQSGAVLANSKPCWTDEWIGSSYGVAGDTTMQPYNRVLMVVDDDRTDMMRGVFGMHIQEHESVNNGQHLLEATAKTVTRIAKLSDTTGVLSVLDTIDYDKAYITRVRDAEHENSKLDEAEQKEWLKHSATRMLTEATITTAQVTSMLVGGLPDVDIKRAMQSFERNGVYKFLSAMLDSGIVGPFAADGFRLNPKLALDQDKLALGEFDVSKNFRKVLIAHHITTQMALHDGDNLLKQTTDSIAENGREKTAVPGSNVNSFGDRTPATMGIGCPASSKDIKFIVNMIVQRL